MLSTHQVSCLTASTSCGSRSISWWEGREESQPTAVARTLGGNATHNPILRDPVIYMGFLSPDLESGKVGRKSWRVSVVSGLGQAASRE